MKFYAAFWVVITILVICTTVITHIMLQSKSELEKFLRLEIALEVLYMPMFIAFNGLDLLILSTYLKFSKRLRTEEAQTIALSLLDNAQNCR
mmetsp:Transcript_22741/g.30339  ORF Transcript_22741/g.30339 Transcript_22741/m.30339 type:complete len:92 (+) Transcript_22741:220-495(+)